MLIMNELKRWLSPYEISTQIYLGDLMYIIPSSQPAIPYRHLAGFQSISYIIHRIKIPTNAKNLFFVVNLHEKWNYEDSDV